MITDLKTSEKIFRKHEQHLDVELSKAIPHIASHEVLIFDRSNRARVNVGHRYNRLCWSYEFNKVWDENLKFVSLTLSYLEPFLFGDYAVNGSIIWGVGGLKNRDARIQSGEIKCTSFQCQIADKITAEEIIQIVLKYIGETAKLL